MVVKSARKNVYYWRLRALYIFYLQHNCCIWTEDVLLTDYPWSPELTQTWYHLLFQRKWLQSISILCANTRSFLITSFCSIINKDFILCQSTKQDNVSRIFHIFKHLKSTYAKYRPVERIPKSAWRRLML